MGCFNIILHLANIYLTFSGHQIKQLLSHATFRAFLHFPFALVTPPSPPRGRGQVFTPQTLPRYVSLTPGLRTTHSTILYLLPPSKSNSEGLRRKNSSLTTEFFPEGGGTGAGLKSGRDRKFVILVAGLDSARSGGGSNRRRDPCYAAHGPSPPFKAGGAARAAVAVVS